jgi:hypothetical protein
MMSRVGGIIQVKVNGEIYRAKGAFDYDIGVPKKEGIVGMDGTHGYKETPQQAYIEGSITDTPELSLLDLSSIADATVTLDLANGKTIVLRNAWWASNSKGNSEEGEIEARFEGISAKEVRN